MKVILILAVVALAVTALPREEALPAFPPATAEEAPETAFAEETEIETELMEDNEQSFSDAQELLGKKGNDACASLADASINEVKSNVKSMQTLLDKLDNGSKCAQEGQPSISAAEKALKKAEDKKKSAEKAIKAAEDAKVNFGDFKFSSLKPNDCASMFSSTAYTSAKAKVESAKIASAKISGEIVGAKKSLKAAKDAAVVAVRKCKCDTYMAHQKALSTSNSRIASENKAAWTKGYHLKCVLAGTSLASCSVPAMPKVTPPRLAAGVDQSACGLPMVSFPIKTPKGDFGQTSSGKLQVKVTAKSQSSYDFVVVNKNVNGWYRGAFLPRKVEKKDLPVTLSFDYSAGGVNNKDSSKAYAFMGFDYVANDQAKAWYDCNGDFILRMRPYETTKLQEYTSGCRSTYSTSCAVGTSGKFQIKISKAGRVDYYMNGKHCLTSQKTANQFPMYAYSVQYGGKATLTNIKLTKG